MKQYLFLVVLTAAIFLEGIVTTTPLVLALLVTYAVSKQREDVFLLAFISGLFLDLLQARTIGPTSIYLLSSVYLVLLYQRKYEISSYPFIALATGILCILYLYIFIHSQIMLQVLVSICIAEGALIFFRINPSLRTK